MKWKIGYLISIIYVTEAIVVNDISSLLKFLTQHSWSHLINCCKQCCVVLKICCCSLCKSLKVGYSQTNCVSPSSLGGCHLWKHYSHMPAWAMQQVQIPFPPVLNISVTTVWRKFHIGWNVFQFLHASTQWALVWALRVSLDSSSTYAPICASSCANIYISI